MDGRTVAWGRLYRSDSLHRIDEADREAFAALGIRTVLDLRRPHEVDRDGRVPAYDGLAYHHIHPEHEEWGRYDRGGDARPLPGRPVRRSRRDRRRRARGQALRVIADPANAPVVVHCVAGKDRTGVVCALTLSLLGVDDAVVADDYALSTEASARFSAWVRDDAARGGRAAAAVPGLTGRGDAAVPRRPRPRGTAASRVTPGTRASPPTRSRRCATTCSTEALRDPVHPAVRVGGPAALDVHK